MRDHNTIQRLATAELLLLLWGWCGVGIEPDAMAQTPPSPAAEAALPDLQAQRDSAEQALSRLPAMTARSKGSSAEQADPALAERRSLLQQLVQVSEQHLDAVRTLKPLRQCVQDADRQNQEWNGFPTPPPYPVLKVDELREAARAMALTVQSIQTRLRMTETLADHAEAELKTVQGRVRQLSERLEGLQDNDKRDGLVQERDLAQLRERVEGARVAMLDAERQKVQEQLAEAKQRVALLIRQRDLAQRQAHFPQEDFDRIAKRIEADRQAIAAELERAVDEQSLQRQAVAAEEAKLAAANAASSVSKAKAREQADRLARLNGVVEGLRLRFDNANLHVDLARQLLDDLEREGQIWDLRFATTHGKLSLTEERDAATKLANAAKQIRGRKEYGLQQLMMVGSRISEIENRLAEAASSGPPQHVQELLYAARHREDLHRRLLQRTDALLEVIENWEAEFSQREQSRSLIARLREMWRNLLAVVGNTWQVELFTAEDSIEVEGKVITGHRSITMGKAVTALAILIVGYWGAGLLARFAERQAITRFQLDPNVANIIRQWAMACFFLVLVLIALMSVKIPITAFAFLGGALAIGVGFGTQNLLKNVISGLLLLVERPLRVGDVIEVDGIRGMVTTIGLRSSTIRDMNGVETLIPNSHLLERNLTNWTYSSYSKRYALRIAVAATSDAQRVRDLLGEWAARHEAVLKEPAPYVLLEDFNEQALVFTVQYWTEIGPRIDPAMVASDLRFVIERGLAQAGIAKK